MYLAKGYVEIALFYAAFMADSTMEYISMCVPESRSKVLKGEIFSDLGFVDMRLNLPFAENLAFQ